MPEPLAKRLKTARTRRKLSQAEMARRIGVTQGAVSHWESGAVIHARNVLAVEREYGIRITRDELLGEVA